MSGPGRGRELQALSTRSSLLERLRNGPDQPEAWSELVRRYGPHIYQWSLRWRAQPADAADLVQEVFVRLVRGMPRFEYDSGRCFRSYLKSLARYAWYDLRRQANAPPSPDGRPESDALEQVEAREDLERRLDEEYDRELLDEAMTLVAGRVALKTWEAFRLQAIEHVPAADVASRLSMKIATVYKARSNVLKMLQQTVQDLERAIDSGDRGSSPPEIG